MKEHRLRVSLSSNSLLLLTLLTTLPLLTSTARHQSKRAQHAIRKAEPELDFPPYEELVRQERERQGRRPQGLSGGLRAEHTHDYRDNPADSSSPSDQMLYWGEVVTKGLQRVHTALLRLSSRKRSPPITNIISTPTSNNNKKPRIHMAKSTKQDTLEECVEYSRTAPWSGPVGDCSAYTSEPNLFFCNVDTDDQHTAAEACPQCGNCQAPIPLLPVATASTTKRFASTNTITFTFAEEVRGFRLSDIVLDAGTTSAALAEVSNTSRSQYLAVVQGAIGAGQYQVSISASTQAVDALNVPIGLTSLTVEVAQGCTSHSDCGDNRYCFSCQKCLAEYDESVCGDCEVSTPSLYGDCGPVSFCENDSDSIDNTCPTVEDPCKCTDSGYSGDVNTGRIGCASWEGMLAPMCYVAKPAQCNSTFDSKVFTGVKWRYCDESDPVGTVSCSNGGVTRPAVAFVRDCNGELVAPESYGGTQDCNTTINVTQSNPNATLRCVCPVDTTGDFCETQLVPLCSLQSETSCDATNAYYPFPVKDHLQYDFRLEGAPMCHAYNCYANTVPLSGTVSCTQPANDVSAFLDETGITQEEYNSAQVEMSSLYAVLTTTLQLTQKPRLYVRVEAIDSNRPFLAGETTGQGISLASIGTVAETQLATVPLPEFVESRPSLISGGRIYMEMRLLGDRIQPDGEVFKIHVDCTEQDYVKVSVPLSSGEMAAIIIVVVVVVLGSAFAVWRWRLKREEELAKKRD